MILVTGSAGFIGRNLVACLQDSGEQVYKLDRVDGDVFEQLAKVPWPEISYIYHLGAISNTTVLDVVDIYNHNIRFGLEIMELAIKYQIPIHYASSGAVYGNSIAQGHYTYNPLNYYALSKLTVDYWVMENKKRFKHVVGLRYFNVYGANEKKDDFATSPIYRFSEQAKKDGVIKIFSGSQHTYRDFVCVEDVIKATVTRSESNIYDVGTSAPINFLDVAELVSKKYDVSIKFIPMPDILKGKYQTYTKARQHILQPYKSVENWLKLN